MGQETVGDLVHVSDGAPIARVYQLEIRRTKGTENTVLVYSSPLGSFAAGASDVIDLVKRISLP